MAIVGRKAASIYGYSNARVKAMESKLLSKSLMEKILAAESPESILSLLFQTDYRKSLEDFGGLKTKGEQIDFALSRNLAKNVSKLVAITPPGQKRIMRSIVGKWDLYNVKLAMDAKARNLPFESISRLIIDYGMYNGAVLNDALRGSTMESMLGRLAINSPYKRILSDALSAYKKTGSTLDAEVAIDKAYYSTQGRVIRRLSQLSPDSARVLRMDIDMKNLLILIRIKRYGMPFEACAPYLIENGTISFARLKELCNGAHDLESLVRSIRLFDLSKGLEAYKSGKSKQLLTFEVTMKNSVFNSSMRLLRHTVLSFATILAYSYLKEIEVFTLRIAINGKAYGLSKDELSGMIVWRAE